MFSKSSSKLNTLLTMEPNVQKLYNYTLSHFFTRKKGPIPMLPIFPLYWDTKESGFGTSQSKQSLTTIGHDWWWSTIIDNQWQPSMIINCDWLRLIMINDDWHGLMMIEDDGQ